MRLELCDRYFVEGKSEESDESEEDGLAKEAAVPDGQTVKTAVAGHYRLHSNEQSADAQVKLEETPSGARLKRKVASFYEFCSQEEESARVELLKYEEEGVICDLRHVRARSDLVEEIDSLTRSIGWMVVDLKPD